MLIGRGIKMKFKLFWSKEDYEKKPDSEKYEESWMYKRLDEGPPTSKDKGLNILQIADWIITFARKLIK